MRIALHIIAALPLSVAFLFLAAVVLDGSGLMHGWGFWHGGFVIAFPFCLAGAFGLLFLVPYFRKGWRGAAQQAVPADGPASRARG